MRIAACNTARVQPSADAIRTQLERILASAQFAGSARMGRFLRYVVERSLAGEADRLKEYVVGIEVFDRGGGYDPRVDSIVRVEAGRLRAKLDEYYYTTGAGDAVRIGLRKGGYAPFFEQRGIVIAQPPAPGVAAPPVPAKQLRALAGVALAGIVALLVAVAVLWDLDRAEEAPVQLPAGPVVAVLPLVPYSGDASAAALGERLTERVTAELVRGGGLNVVPSVRTARFNDPRAIPEDVGRQLGAQYLLRGRVSEEGRELRAELVLMNAALTRKPWAHTFLGKPEELDEIARQIAQRVGEVVASMP